MFLMSKPKMLPPAPRPPTHTSTYKLYICIFCVINNLNLNVLSARPAWLRLRWLSHGVTISGCFITVSCCESFCRSVSSLWPICVCQSYSSLSGLVFVRLLDPTRSTKGHKAKCLPWRRQQNIFCYLSYFMNFRCFSVVDFWFKFFSS